MPHRYTDQIIAVVDQCVKNAELSYNCLFLGSKTAQKADEIAVELCEFDVNQDRNLWEYKLTFPKQPRMIMKTHNLMYEISGMLDALDPELVVLSVVNPTQMYIHLTVIQRVN
jgi:hypothetical protein